jgi:hypothetical protein
MSGWLGSTGQKSTASHEEPLPSKSYCSLIGRTAKAGIATNRCDGYRPDTLGNQVSLRLKLTGLCTNSKAIFFLPSPEHPRGLKHKKAVLERQR